MQISFRNQLNADFPHIVTAGLPGCYLPDEVVTLDNRDEAIEFCESSILDFLESSELTDSAIESKHDEACESIRETGVATVLERQWTIDVSPEDHELLAIAKHADCEPDEVSEERFNHYGLRVFSVGRAEYAIGTDLECDEACKAYTLEALWAFNSEFLANYTVLTADELDSLRGDRCEDCNAAIVALVGDDIDELVEDAIGCDGRGHFLADYDGYEYDVRLADTEYFIYRIN